MPLWRHIKSTATSRAAVRCQHKQVLARCTGRTNTIKTPRRDSTYITATISSSGFWSTRPKKSLRVLTKSQARCCQTKTLLSNLTFHPAAMKHFLLNNLGRKNSRKFEKILAKFSVVIELEVEITCTESINSYWQHFSGE